MWRTFFNFLMTSISTNQCPIQDPATSFDPGGFDLQKSSVYRRKYVSKRKYLINLFGLNSEHAKKLN